MKRGRKNRRPLTRHQTTPASCRIRSPAFSAIITMGALVLPETSVGIAEPSITRRPAMPCTRRRASTTASGALPMRQGPAGWKGGGPGGVIGGGGGGEGMEDGGAVGAAEIEQLGGARGLRPGLHFTLDIGGERGRLGNRARSLHAGHGGCA